jgi:hypothetical protein
MDFTNIKAIAVDLEVNDNLLIQELLAIPSSKWVVDIDPSSGHFWKNIFLTKNNFQVFNDFKSAKSIPHSAWYWDNELHIPYIQSLVESLPINTIGMIRAFILDGPLVMHVDSNVTTPEDSSYKMGLTIASELQVPMSMPGIEVKEKYVLFNDAVPHGFPKSNGRQISIRVFGDFDYDKFKIIKAYT